MTVQAVLTLHHPRPHEYQEIANTYTRAQWGEAYVFFVGIWAIKASFLALYFDLTHNLRPFRIAWFIIVVVTLLTFIGNFLAYYLLTMRKTIDISFQNKAINYEFATDFVTDVLSKTGFHVFAP